MKIIRQGGINENDTNIQELEMAESHTGINGVLGCSVENQKGAIDIDFAQQ